MLEFTCPERELSCIIGNLFTELEPPCSACDGEPQGIKICGTTYAGNRAVLIIAGDRFYFSGGADEIARIREKRCVHWDNSKKSNPNL